MTELATLCVIRSTTGDLDYLFYVFFVLWASELVLELRRNSYTSIQLLCGNVTIEDFNIIEDMGD